MFYEGAQQIVPWIMKISMDQRPARTRLLRPHIRKKESKLRAAKHAFLEAEIRVLGREALVNCAPFIEIWKVREKWFVP